MSDHTGDIPAQQEDLFAEDEVRSLLDQLLADSRLYRHGKDYKALFDFDVRVA